MRNPPIISSVLVVSDKREFALIVCNMYSAKLGHVRNRTGKCSASKECCGGYVKFLKTQSIEHILLNYIYMTFRLGRTVLAKVSSGRFPQRK